jgi:hypothetical protein
MKEIFSTFLNKISSIMLDLENRWLLAYINKIYTIEIDLDEKKLLEAHGRSFRKLLEDDPKSPK